MSAWPVDYKQALVAGATPLLCYDAYDQGAGFVDAADALLLPSLARKLIIRPNRYIAVGMRIRADLNHAFFTPG